MRIISGKEEILEKIPQILYDESKFHSGIPQKICFPQSENDLQNILKEANSNNTPVCFVGGQTGTTGGATPVEGCIAICFSSMNKINSIKWEATNPVLYCEPGVTLSAISEFLSSPSKWPYQVPGTDLLQNQKFIFPPDPTETTAQLGGVVATNASGARSFRFGPTRAFVMYLGCILATGEKLELTRGKNPCKDNSFSILTDQNRYLTIAAPSFSSPSVKNASGFFSKPQMDLIDLIIGSEGTLAAVSEIGIRLEPSVRIISGMSFFENMDSAFDFADFLRTDSQVLSIEYYDQNALAIVSRHNDHLSTQFPEYPENKNSAVFWEFMENCSEPFELRFDLWEKHLIQCGSSFDQTWSGFDPSELQRLRMFRHAVPELINSVIAANKINYHSIRKTGTDTAIPGPIFRKVYSEYLTIIKKCNIEYVSFGHLGDYHLHINLIPGTDLQMTSALEIYQEIMDITIKNNGTISAEHGVGKIKKQYFQKMYGPDAIMQMRNIKAAFDPKNILNYENLF